MKTAISICLVQLVSIIRRLQAQPDDDTYLILANRRFVRKINLSTSTNNTLFYNDESMVLGLDLDVRTRDVFWSDVQQDTIVQADLSGKVVKTLVSQQVEEPVDVAWDWINKKLYWVDVAFKTLEVIDPSTGYRKALLRFEDKKPRAIKLDPIRRWIYWSAWSEEALHQDGEIIRTSMDGKSSTVLLDMTHVTWPNGLALDFNSQTLYWVDAVKDTISQSRADGTNPQVLKTLNGTKFANRWYSFGVEYYDGNVYFGDWLSDSVFSLSVNSFSRTLTRVVQLTHDPGNLRVVDVERQPTGENPCAVGNGGCTHLCLLSNAEPSGYSCVCPDGIDPLNCSYFTGSVVVNSELTETNNLVLEPNVNEEIGCDIRDVLNIRVTATSSSGTVLSTRYVRFTNDSLFLPVPSGEHNCTVEIVTSGNIKLDVRRIPCSTKPQLHVPQSLQSRGSSLVIVATVLSFSTLVALLAGFSAGVIAVQWRIKRRCEQKTDKKLPDTSEHLPNSDSSVKLEKKLSTVKIVTQPDPHYEELPKQSRNPILLEDNIAYGHSSTHGIPISYSSESNTLV